MSKQYSIEFAVKASTELQAMDRLKDLGVKHADEAKLTDLDRQAGLFIINTSISEDEMPDDIYNKISKAKDVFILSDQLSESRGHEVFKLALQVERQLKKLLICVLPETEKVLMDIVSTHQKHNTRSIPTGRIEWCKKIHDFSFGEIPSVLEKDMSQLARDKLNTGEAMLLLITESKDFDDLKLRAETLFEAKTIWSSINSILEKPVQYEHISGALNKIIKARNDAAHQNTITKKMFDETKKNQKHITSYISGIKSTYRDSLKVNMEQLGKSMRSIMDSVAIIDPAALTGFQEKMSQVFQPATEAIAKMKFDFASPAISTAIAQNVGVQSQFSKAFAESFRNMQSLHGYDDIISELKKNNLNSYIENAFSEIRKIQPDIQAMLDAKRAKEDDKPDYAQSLKQVEEPKK